MPKTRYTSNQNGIDYRNADAVYGALREALGMDPEVAADLGYPVDWDEAIADMTSGRRVRQILESQVGMVLCGECCDSVPIGSGCSHISVSGDGAVTGKY